MRWILLLMAAALVTACAGGNEDIDPNDLLLTLDDLPAGWSLSPSGDDDESTSGGFCDAEPVDSQYPPSGKGDASFQRGSTGPFLTQALATYDSTGTAQDALSYVRESFGCTEWVSDDTVWAIAPMSFPSIGDESHAVRMSADAGLFSFEFDIVYFRSGTVLSIIGHGAMNGVDSEQTIAFVEMAADKAP